MCLSAYVFAYLRVANSVLFIYLIAVLHFKEVLDASPHLSDINVE